MRELVLDWVGIISLAILAFLLMVSLASEASPISSVNQPQAVLDWGHNDWSVELLKLTRGHLRQLDKATDISLYCPKYLSLNEEKRSLVWGRLAVAIAKFESNYNPKSQMTESNGSVSQGLFQLTYGDRFCPQTKAEGDLNDPFINMSCAVKLMADYVEKDGKVASGGYTKYGSPPSRGLARYWSVIRVPDRKSKHHLAEIKSITSKAPVCD